MDNDIYSLDDLRVSYQIYKVLDKSLFFTTFEREFNSGKMRVTDDVDAFNTAYYYLSLTIFDFIERYKVAERDFAMNNSYSLGVSLEENIANMTLSERARCMLLVIKNFY